MNKTVQLCVGGVGLLLSTTALADFVVRADAPPAATPAVAPPVPAMDLGDAATLYARSAPLALGFADHLPLGEALRLLLPAGWHAEAAPSLVQTRVSWRGGAPWPLVLQQLASARGWTAQIDVAAQRVRLAPAAPPAPAQAAPGKKPDPLAPQASLQGATSAFTIPKGALIARTLQDWAARAGWTVVWQITEDWAAPNIVSFDGPFEAAVKQVVEALAANGANIHLTLYTANKTAVVSGAGGGE